MALTRLKNVFTSKTGRCLYVNSDDFDASDAFDNRGNSPNRPFKSIQRALLEAARFSYRSGQYNDAFESFSIVLYPGDYFIDNRPGKNASGQAYVSADISELSSASDMDLIDGSGNPNPNNILYRFNSVEGGVVVPRGTSIVGMDLRKTKLRPLYVPDPAAGAIEGSAIFRVTGGCYFWQFSFFDGPSTGVYKDPAQPSASSPPTYSHHKLTCFEYADGTNIQSGVNDTSSAALAVTDLDLYYQKVAKAFSDIPDSTSVLTADELQSRVEENRIVGPNTSGPKQISSVVTDYVNTNVFTTTAEVTTTTPHGFSVNTPVLVSGVTGTDASRFNGSYYISEIPTTTTFRYIIKDPTTGAPSGNPTATGSTVEVEVDNVDSSSPYIFNCSLRSTWGMQGMHADGSKSTGFKSMVVAQFTGVSLQKDDNAFIKWDGSSYIAGSHTDGDSIYKTAYRNFHVKVSNDAVIQAVSVFAVGFADHFVSLSGGDQSITNSNSNFGSCALRAKGFKSAPFTQDKAGTITHIIPPQKLARTYTAASGYTFAVTQDNKTATPTPANDNHGITLGSYVRFNTIDNVETYKVDAVNSGTGVLTLNRGYRGSTAASESAFKSTINEIPVGYVAVDVQKVQYNANAGNSTWTSGASFNTDLGRYSCIYNGNAYYSAQLAAASGTVTAGSTAPTHTSGTVSDGAITWSYIGPVDTRLYLYGYNSAATKPPYKLQGFNIGARKQDVLYVSLIESSATVTFAALITPDGTSSPADSAFTNITTQNFTPGDPNHPLQFDSQLNTWYVKVTAATSGAATVQAATGYRGIHYHLGNDTFYANALFTGASYMQRVPDNRSSRDRTYRVRYEVDSSPSALSREPINGYVIQPRNVPTGQSYGDVYYIYDIKTEQELIKSVQNGIYYMTVIKGSISPSNANVDQFSFSQNINNLYPVLDKDNPTEDPNEATSVASNTVVGLVTTTDIGTGLEDKSLSITKEVIADFILENRNAYVNSSTNDPAVANYITLEARDGESNEVDKNERMIPVNNTGGTQTELRRPSILRSGNHTFEYVGFGPGNYSTGLPQISDRTLTEREEFLAQSQETSCGTVVYTGMNDKGDFYIGNTKISADSGQQTTFDIPIPTVTGEDPSKLSVVFDEVIIKERLLVEGGSSKQILSQFNGPVTFNGITRVNNLFQSQTIKVGTSHTVYINNDDEESESNYDEIVCGSTLQGALQVKGGASIGKNLNICGKLGVKNNAASTNTNSGAIVTAGGVGIGGALNVGGSGSFAGNVIFNGGSHFPSNKLVSFGGATVANKKGAIYHDSESSNNNLRITATDDNTHLYLQSNNRVVIGNKDNTEQGLVYTKSDGAVKLYYGGSGAHVFETVTGGAKVTGQLDVTGDIIAYSASDHRLKDNITPIENPLEKILTISGNTFNWNQASNWEGKADTGLIAQEIQGLGLPGLHTIREDGTHAVDYEKVIPLLVESVKELTKRLEGLEHDLRFKK